MDSGYPLPLSAPLVYWNHQLSEKRGGKILGLNNLRVKSSEPSDGIYSGVVGGGARYRDPRTGFVPSVPLFCPGKRWSPQGMDGL